MSKKDALAGLNLVYQRSREKLISTFTDPDKMEEMKEVFKREKFERTADETAIGLIRDLDYFYKAATSEIGVPSLENPERIKKAISMLMLVAEESLQDLELKLGIETEGPGLEYPAYKDDPLGVTQEAFDEITHTFVTLANFRGLI